MPGVHPYSIRLAGARIVAAWNALWQQCPPCGGDHVTICSSALLPACLPCRMQQPDQHCAQQVLRWHQFASRQAQRYVPPPASPSLHLSSESTCYRLRILSVSGLPLLSPVTGTFCEVQLGVSLYHEALGTFYGNTCYSQLDPPQQQGLQGSAAAATMECCFDVYFHSFIADPHCKAVVRGNQVAVAISLIAWQETHWVFYRGINLMLYCSGINTPAGRCCCARPQQTPQASISIKICAM